MSAGSFEADIRGSGLVEQQPVRLDVQIAPTFPSAFQEMIIEARG